METPRRRALGKGLEELFNAEVLDFDSLEEKIVTETPKEEIVDIKIDELRSNPYQPISRLKAPSRYRSDRSCRRLYSGSKRFLRNPPCFRSISSGRCSRGKRRCFRRY